MNVALRRGSPNLLSVADALSRISSLPSFQGAFLECPPARVCRAPKLKERGRAAKNHHSKAEPWNERKLHLGCFSGVPESFPASAKS